MPILKFLKNLWNGPAMYDCDLCGESIHDYDSFRTRTIIDYVDERYNLADYFKVSSPVHEQCKDIYRLGKKHGQGRAEEDDND